MSANEIRYSADNEDEEFDFERVGEQTGNGEGNKTEEEEEDLLYDITDESDEGMSSKSETHSSIKGIPYQYRENIALYEKQLAIYRKKLYEIFVWKKKLPKDEIPAKPRPHNHRPIGENIWFLPNDENIFMKIHKSAATLKDITNSAGYVLYIVNENLDRIFVCPRRWDRFYINRHSWQIRVGTTIASYVVKKKTGIIVDTAVVDTRFPRGQELGRQFDDVTDVITVPLLDFKGSCWGALEFYRENEVPYEEEHLKLISYFLNWIGEAILQNKEEVLYQSMLETYQYLLNCLVEALDLENEPTSGSLPNKFYHEVMHLMSSLTNAERAAIFVNKNNQTMKATCTWHSKKDSKNYEKLMSKKEKLLADLTIKYGWLINMDNVFTDTRFNNKADIESGYIIRSVLQTPFIVRKGGVGGLQLFNKLSGMHEFIAIDEIISSACSGFCAIWYYYTELWDKILKKINSNIIFEDSIYHQIAQEQTDEEIYEDVREVPDYLTEFSFFSLQKDKYNLPRLIYIMFQTVCDLKLTDYKVLYNFIYIVQRCYRQDFFFNFSMFGSCTQTVFLILYTYPEIFNNHEKISLMIAILCIAVDRQCSAKCSFIRHPLLEIYDDIPMNRHVSEMMKFMVKTASNSFVYLTKLQQRERNLKNLKTFLSRTATPFHECDLATDYIQNGPFQMGIFATDVWWCFQTSGLLNNFDDEDQENIIHMAVQNIRYTRFPNYIEIHSKRISELLAKKEFNWQKPGHRKYLRLIIMISGEMSMLTRKLSSFHWSLHLLLNDIESAQSCEVDTLSPQFRQDTYRFLAREFEIVMIPALTQLKTILPFTQTLYDQLIINYKELTSLCNTSNILESEQNIFGNT